MEEGLLMPLAPRVEGKIPTWKTLVEELKKCCYIALPLVGVIVSQNLLRLVSMSMVGRLGEIELAGAAIATSLTNVTGFSLLFGMACALETLCGQAYGAGQYQKLGIYTYGAIISLVLVCLPVSILWLFMDKVLIFVGQDPSISAEACVFSVWLIPTLFPYAILQLIIRYLQTQSLIFPMLWSSIAALAFHIPVCWALIFKFELGNAGAALSIGLSYTVNLIILLSYINRSPACEKTRVSFSKEVFPSIREFFHFAIPSAVITCLEWWSYELVTLLSGLLPNPQLETSVLSICLTISYIHYYILYSFGAAASIRVSNELGAGNPEAAKVAVLAALVLGAVEAIITSSILFCCRSVLGYAFGNDKELINYVREITPILCFSVFADSIQAILSGVARGSGWQHIGVYINLGSYYLVGIPMAIVFGFVLHLRSKGLCGGVITGLVVQAVLLILVTFFTNWQEQAKKARERMLAGRISDD